jgi:hypothetical protein
MYLREKCVRKHTENLKGDLGVNERIIYYASYRKYRGAD